MITTPALINSFILALTPMERWQAARQFNNSSVMTESWFVTIMVIALIVMVILLFVVSYNEKAKQRKSSRRSFANYAAKRGLSERERRILREIAGKAGLKRSAAIFNAGSAFEHGAAKMIAESLDMQGADSSKNLRTELSFLREKLGFQKRPLSPTDPTLRLKRMSSRQIPVGKKLHITRRKTDKSVNIESTITKNDYMELAVKLASPLESTAGEPWLARYYFGSSAWEFETSAISCNGNVLVLNHNDNVRVINRRRFLRVPVNKPVFIAHFPFVRNLDKSKQDSFDSPRILPAFVPATVTELAGPGLRIKAPIQVNTGDRVLIVLKLDEEKGHDKSILPWKSTRDNKASTQKIIEDIGEVRHTEVTQTGLSIAVELTGLSDSDVNELIRATNTAARKANLKSQDIPDFVNTEESLPQPVTA